MTDVEESIDASDETDEELEDEERNGEPLTLRFSEAQVQEITTYLRSGRRLPAHLFPHLFEAPKEYELSYAGKSRRVDVLAETMSVPLQPAREFGDARGPIAATLPEWTVITAGGTSRPASTSASSHSRTS